MQNSHQTALSYLVFKLKLMVFDLFSPVQYSYKALSVNWILDLNQHQRKPAKITFYHTLPCLCLDILNLTWQFLISSSLLNFHCNIFWLKKYYQVFDQGNCKKSHFFLFLLNNRVYHTLIRMYIKLRFKTSKTIKYELLYL